MPPDIGQCIKEQASNLCDSPFPQEPHPGQRPTQWSITPKAFFTRWRCYWACIKSTYHYHEMGKFLTAGCGAEFRDSGSSTDLKPMPGVLKRNLWKFLMPCSGHTQGRWGLEVRATKEQWAYPRDLGKLISPGSTCPHTHNSFPHRPLQELSKEQELTAWQWKER